MRVLQVIGSMNRGGAEAMIMNLYRDMDRTRVQFDFVEHTSKTAAFDDEITALGGRIYHCPHYTGKNHFQYVSWWKKFLSEHGSDYSVVHGHIGSTAAIYLSLCKKHGIYTIAHSHNINAQVSIGSVVYAIFSYPVRNIAEQLFACSREAGISRYGKKRGKDEKKCIVLNNAIDTEKFAFNPDQREALRKELGIDEKIVIGHVGRFNTQKNHHFLLQIFKELHAVMNSTVLVLVGDGDLRPDIERQIAGYNLTDSVILTGVQSDTAQYYQAMDLLLFPSLYEGLPVTMVEAQTAGLRCVISDKVPRESIIADELVSVCSLEESARTWADHVMQCIPYERKSYQDTVTRAGYDIHTTAVWLEEFYLEHEK